MTRKLRVWQRLRHNLGLKLLALLIGFVLWGLISHQPLVEVGLRIPVEYRNVPANLEVSSEQSPILHVRLRGPAALVRRASRADVIAALDLSDATPGVRSYPLASHVIHAPYGLEVVNVWPDRLQLSFERSLSKLVDISPRITGTPASGLRLSGFTVFPRQVRIIGPASHVNGIDQVFTDPFSIAGLTSTATLRVGLAAPDPQVRIVGADNARITIDVAARR